MIKNNQQSKTDLWKKYRTNILTPELPFEEHKKIYDEVFSNWDEGENGVIPTWVADEDEIKESNIYTVMQEIDINSYKKFYQFSIEQKESFWEKTIQKLEIKFSSPYSKILDLNNNIEKPFWFCDAKMNIIDSCFSAEKNAVAIKYKNKNKKIIEITYGELEILTNKFANGLLENGFKKNDCIAICMPMTLEAVTSYLAIIKIGAVVVSIADSFTASEIQTRLKISKAKGIISQDFIERGVKKISLYEKIVEANSPKAIVFCKESKTELRKNDIYWQNILNKNKIFHTQKADPYNHINILFSSGTTGTPKAIPWNHTTAIKSAADGFYHQNIKKNDVLCWPTNIGWMMGPWLIFASLINKATIALYTDDPISEDFIKFVEKTKVNILGLIPTIVKGWINNNLLKNANWENIKIFSSTGECSNKEDYFYLMSRIKKYRPVIEYCGGTEIGGGYISSTILQINSPSTFSTPTLGTEFILLNDKGKKCLDDEEGEVFIVPPSLGLSTELLNKDHHETYFADTPKTKDGRILRRHGDEMITLKDGYFKSLGRADDTMNLGGIKTSSIEIENIINFLEEVKESAAIAISKNSGPKILVIYIVLQKQIQNKNLLEKAQKNIKEKLNPLFKISELIITDKLPRTNTGKIMRKTLRKEHKIL